MRMLITLAVSIALLAGWSAGSTAAASTLLRRSRLRLLPDDPGRG